MSDASFQPDSEDDESAETKSSLPVPACPFSPSQAVALYLTNGSLAAVARELGTTVYELQKLAKTQWWTDEIGHLRRVEQATLDTSLSEILGLALTKLVTAMTNGEEAVTSEGVPYMKPVSAAVLCKIADTVFDKRQLIRGLPTSVSNESSKLSELAAKLEELGRSQAARTIEAAPIADSADGESQ